MQGLLRGCEMPMNYPYGLLHNPYPSSPTPTEKDAQILGGTRHIQAKESIFRMHQGSIPTIIQAPIQRK